MAESQGMHSAGTILFVGPYTIVAPVARPVGPDWQPGGQLGLTGWYALPELIDINGLDLRPSDTRVTHLRSDGKTQEKVPGFKDPNQVSARFNYFKSFMLALVNLVPGGANAPDVPLGFGGQNHTFWGRKKWFLQLPDGGGWYFTGYLAGQPVQVPEDDRTTLDVNVTVSGPPTWIPLP